VQRPWLRIPIQSLSGAIAVYCHSEMLRRAILHWQWHRIRGMYDSRRLGQGRSEAIGTATRVYG